MGAEHPTGDYNLRELNKMVEQDNQKDPPKFDPENRKLGDSSSKNRNADYFKPYDPKDGDPEEKNIQRMIKNKKLAEEPIPETNWDLNELVTDPIDPDLQENKKNIDN